MRWARHIARTGEGEKRAYINGRDYLEFLGKDGRIILKWITKKSVGRSWTELNWFRIGTMLGSRESGDKPSSNTICW
jgi:hypothetical protein